MMTPNQYSFRKVTLDDLNMLTGWRSNAHVREWWDSDEPYDEADLADPRVTRWIVSNAERPFAFMQDYAVHGWEEHHLPIFPRARGELTNSSETPK